MILTKTSIVRVYKVLIIALALASLEYDSSESEYSIDLEPSNVSFDFARIVNDEGNRNDKGKNIRSENDDAFLINFVAGSSVDQSVKEISTTSFVGDDVDEEDDRNWFASDENEVDAISEVESGYSSATIFCKNYGTHFKPSEHLNGHLYPGKFLIINPENCTRIIRVLKMMKDKFDSIDIVTDAKGSDMSNLLPAVSKFSKTIISNTGGLKDQSVVRLKGTVAKLLSVKARFDFF